MRKKKSEVNSLVVTGILLVILIVFSVLIGRLGNSSVTYTIELNGDSSVVVYKGSSYVDPGAKAYDDQDNDLTKNIIVNSNVDVYNVGRYVIEYSLGETSVKRHIRVIDNPNISDGSSDDGDSFDEVVDEEDDLPTKIVLNGEKIVYIDLNGSYKEDGFKAVDKTDGNISKKVEVTHNIDNTKVGNYEIVYSVKNSLGVTTSVKRNVVVMDVSLVLSLSSDKYSNFAVGVNIKVNDKYLDYVLLPDGGKITSDNYIHNVYENGTYKFVLYNKYGIVKEYSIDVNNIDKVNPTGSCSANFSNGKTIINVFSNDNVGIDRYVVNGKSYTSSEIVLDSLSKTNNVVIYDKAGNTASASCNVESSVYIDSVVNDGVIVTVKAGKVNSSINGYYFSYSNKIPDKKTGGDGGFVATSQSSIDVVRLPGTTYVWVEDSNGNVSAAGTITLSNKVLLLSTGSSNILKGQKLNAYLSDNGWSIEELNKLMARSVRAAGVYTKTGAATAGVTLSTVLYQKFKIKIPYWRGGKTSSMGAYYAWGMYRENPTYEGYNYYGMDCDGFVNWAFKNTGIVYSDILAASYYYWSGLPLTKENGEVGDVIRTTGHVKLIVGKNDKGFLVVEEAGRDSGLIMNVHPYTNTNDQIIIKGERLTSTYGHMSISEYPSGF